MALVVIMTTTAEYRGELDLTGGTGVQIRLLDALNMPSRLRFGASRAEPSLSLENVVRRIRSSGATAPSGPGLIVRPAQVQVAYEVVDDAVEYEAIYERRQEAVDERLILYASGDLRIEGFVRGGLQALTVAKPERPFVACTQVTMFDLASDSGATSVPFMALNMGQVESYGRED